MVVILLVEQSINNPKFESSNADHANNSWKWQKNETFLTINSSSVS